MKSSLINKEIRDLGYNIFRHDTDYELLCDHKIINRLLYRLHEFQFCCGFYEMGNVSLDYDILPEHRKATDLFLKSVFLETKERMIEGGGDRQHGFVFVSNGINACRAIEPILVELSDDFLMASSTINPGSDNTLKLFVAQY